MSGRPATTKVIPGRGALSVGNPQTPLPPGWAWVELLGIARLESGHTPSRRHPEYWGGEVPWLGIRDAREHHLKTITTTSQTITQQGLDNSAARILPERAVCLSRTASIGYTLILGRPMATSQDFVSWICSDVLVPEYLMYALHNEGREGLARFGEGTVHKTIYFPTVKAFHIALPPLGEQRRIVERIREFLARLQDTTRELSQLPEQIRELGIAILRAAYSGDLTARWRRSKPRARSKQLVAELAEQRKARWFAAQNRKPYMAPSSGSPPAVDIPRTWAWITLEAATDPVRPIQYGILKPGPHVPQGVPYVKVRDIRNGKIVVDDLHRTSPTINAAYLRSTLAKDDVLVSIRGTYGKVALVPESLHGANITQDSARIAPLEGLDARFLCILLQAPQTQRRLEELAKGIAVQGVNIADLRMICIPLPPFEEQLAIVAAVDAALARVALIQEMYEGAHSELLALEHAVFTMAFRGALVERDPEERPVSEQIKEVQMPIGEKDPTRVPRRRRAAKADTGVSRDSLWDAIRRLPNRFTFRDIESALPGDYEELRAALFSLLSAEDAPVRQIFDEQTETILFVKSAS